MNENKDNQTCCHQTREGIHHACQRCYVGGDRESAGGLVLLPHREWAQGTTSLFVMSYSKSDSTCGHGDMDMVSKHFQDFFRFCFEIA